ncbi:MAG TPA: dihydrofolate reductase family protein, partial [Asticcacaulis sp.]
WAERLNAMPKYVLSSTLKTPEWSNATVLSGDLSGEIMKLTSRIDGDIVVIGSLQLVQALWTHDLVDELRLKVFPVTLGGGRRLFPENGEMKNMRRTAAAALGDGLSYLIYERAR